MENIYYKHRQIGYVIISAALIIMLYSIIYLFKGNFSLIEFTLLISITSACLLLFYSLTVEITDTNIKASMGIGIIRRNINLENVKDCRIVKNRWYTGWGIRMIPGGVLFNVSGFSAVELILNNGKVFRIGTDDAESLNNILKNLISHSEPLN